MERSLGVGRTEGKCGKRFKVGLWVGAGTMESECQALRGNPLRGFLHSKSVAAVGFGQYTAGRLPHAFHGLCLLWLWYRVLHNRGFLLYRLGWSFWSVWNHLQAAPRAVQGST